MTCLSMAPHALLAASPSVIRDAAAMALSTLGFFSCE